MIPIKIFALFYFIIYLKSSISVEFCDVGAIHAIVLARGGSKGIKNKNLVKINNESILGRTLSTLKKSNLFQYIWVSSDSDMIIAEALKYKVLIHRRPEEYARDETTSLESINEFLTHHSSIVNFALFQCTSVFLEDKFIRKALNLYEIYGCVFSVTRSHHLRWIEINNKILPVNFNPKSRPRRQDWNGELYENGMFYFSNRRNIENGYFQNESCSVVEIENKFSLEIDDSHDIDLARCLLKLDTTSFK